MVFFGIEAHENERNVRQLAAVSHRKAKKPCVKILHFGNVEACDT
jgi:hypothetical protein